MSSTGKAGKAIALFSDGTGNTAIKGRGTNVFKTYEALDLGSNGNGGANVGRRQLAFYDDGVGTERNKLVKLLGGAFGWGLKRNVLELYAQLCRVYEPGDDVYLFGFSRGAYTARTLAGLIVECGLLKDAAGLADADLDRLARKAYGAFREHFRTWQGQKFVADDAGSKATAAFRGKHSIHAPEFPDGRGRIRFLGVWDTVDAVGLPFDHLAVVWNAVVYPFRFPGFKLSPEVAKGCHAVSLDDERHTFHPVMWDETGEDNGRIEQVWFPGVHSNVGGGYPKQGLSLIALDWMMTRAEQAGLRFVAAERDRYRDLQNPHDKLYDSRSGLAVYYRYKPRDVAEICKKSGVPKIHASVFERIAAGTQGYAPGNLPDDFETVWTDPAGGTLSPGAQRARASAVADAPAAGGGDTSRPAPNPRLLPQVRWRVALRRGLQYAFVATTLGALVFALRFSWILEESDREVALEVPKWLDTAAHWLAAPVPGDWFYDWILHPFLDAPPVGLGLLAVLTIIYLASRFLRSSCRRLFESFWRRAVGGGAPAVQSRRAHRRSRPRPPEGPPSASAALKALTLPLEEPRGASRDEPHRRRAPTSPLQAGEFTTAGNRSFHIV